MVPSLLLPMIQLTWDWGVVGVAFDFRYHSIILSHHRSLTLFLWLFLTQRAAHTLFVCLIGCSPCRSPYVVVVVCLYQSQCVCMTYSFFSWAPLREFVFALTVVNRVGLHSLTTQLEKVIFTGVMFLFIVSVNRLARDGIMCWSTECD